jgi:phosphate/phosphite/phosphonate ABC transporter binding protein
MPSFGSTWRNCRVIDAAAVSLSGGTSGMAEGADRWHGRRQRPRSGPRVQQAARGADSEGDWPAGEALHPDRLLSRRRGHARQARRWDASRGVFLPARRAGSQGRSRRCRVTATSDPAVYDASLRPEYYSVSSVKKGSGIRSLADIKGRSFTFVEPASTSGHLVPKTELIKAGLAPDKDVRTMFAGSHPGALIALWNGKADASATAETILSRIAASQQIEYCGFPDHQIGRPRSKADIKAVFDACPDGKLVAIHYSDPIPGTPLALRGDLPANLKAIIKASLLSTPDDSEFIKAAKRWYVDPSKEKGLANLDACYSSIRELAKLLDLDLKTLQ